MYWFFRLQTQKQRGKNNKIAEETESWNWRCTVMCFYSLQQEAGCSGSMRSGYYRGRGENNVKTSTQTDRFVGFWSSLSHYYGIRKGTVKCGLCSWNCPNCPICPSTFRIAPRAECDWPAALWAEISYGSFYKCVKGGLPKGWERFF